VQRWNRKSVLWNHKGNVFKGAAYLKHTSDNYPEGMPHVFRFSGIIMAHEKVIIKQNRTYTSIILSTTNKTQRYTIFFIIGNAETASDMCTVLEFLMMGGETA
jgi:hypothetical protein